jgi:hypothetical protein
VVNSDDLDQVVKGQIAANYQAYCCTAAGDQTRFNDATCTVNKKQ